jgi:uncharacterized protein YcfL
MRMIWLAGAVLALSACSSNSSTDANANGGDANALATDNSLLDQNVTAEDQNAIAGAAANGADANTVNQMKQDATTHDHDTNLANGI